MGSWFSNYHIRKQETVTTASVAAYIRDLMTGQHCTETTEAEAVIQAMVAGKYLDPTDVMNGFRDEKCRDTVLNYCGKYGIK